MKRFAAFIMFFSSLFGSDSMPFIIPTVELNNRTDLQTIVDQEDGIYLGHPSTVLLEDGKTILIVYPKGHGKGEIIYKRSEDGGETWSDRLIVPHNWSSS
ncbi:MAG: sialidase family protein, partial [Candidatus Neomarinimicrobiota bacterium]|nr:sialidase family protein [Candidatus Neomarinimicrobiota bacterium]